ncbi:MAG TPA: hypothetical protein VIH57_10575 [Bacteroidales bacterium]
MEIKGTAIKTTRDFVKANFPARYDAWINALPEKTKAIYSSTMINMAGWYPMKEDYHVPIDKIVEMFYGGNAKTAGEAIGKFSADIALTGIYKLFLMVATPKYLMTRASVVFSTFYLPCDIKVSESSSKSVAMQVTKFPEMTQAVEYRIAGWCVRALELCGCKNIQYKIPHSLLKGDNMTEFLYSWD